MSPLALPVCIYLDETEEPTEAPSLYIALAEPPQSPESRITRGGVLLAESHPEATRWILTAQGRQVLRTARRHNYAAWARGAA